ncbi:50S ribosomal protein L5 [Candidatus Gottesmanbacteria bacterium]|nr:50S ribosomal protein L5 [Candidatus Gottesmanbacteria bacterium]
MQNFYQKFQKEGIVKLKEELGIKNALALPRLLKIVINVSLGEALTNKNAIENTMKQIAVIVGQKPIVTHAKRDISTFKLRKGDAIGVKVTLRGIRMYDFLEKLIKITLPRIRDFRGLPLESFDGKGNYTLGISEQIVFPEIEYSEVDKTRGLEISIVTSGKDKKQTMKLLEIFGLPFVKNK